MAHKKTFQLKAVVDTMETQGHSYAYIIGDYEHAFYRQTLADNFAARHGLGEPKRVALKTLQDKLAKQSQVDSQNQKADGKKEGK